MHKLIRAVALLALAACGATAPASFRNKASTIYSVASLAPADIAGDWVQVATFGAACRGGPAGQARFTPTAGGGLGADLSLCLNGQRANYRGRAVPGGPGRLSLVGGRAPLDQPIWVLWIDAEARTLALGTPSGEFGVVLNRTASLPTDRARAAADVFRFSGYDGAKLQFFR